MSKVSALVSAYNAKEFLDKRITNLFGQVGKNDFELEIVVVCQSGSPEDRIASNYNVKIHRTPDVPTLGQAWNIGICNATGDYLTTANCDDRYHIGGLAAMVHELDKYPGVGLVFSQVDQDDGRLVFPWRRLERSSGIVADMPDILRTRCIIGPMPLWRSQIHRDIGYWFNEEMIVAADYDMWVHMAQAGVKFYYVEDSCGIYMKRADGLEHSHPELCRMESRQVREAMA